MKRRYGWIEILEGDEVQRTYPLVEGSTRIGRAPDNELVFPSPSVSGHHALVEVGPAHRVIDLQSRNGTFLNGERVDGGRALRDGDSLRIGLDVHLRMRVQAPDSPSDVLGWLWDLRSGRCFPVPADGGALSALIEQPSLAADGPFRLEPTADGARLLGPDGETPISFRAPFQVSGRHLELVDREHALASTAAVNEASSWELRVDLNGPTGAQADVIAPGGDLRGSIRAGNRVALLHLLSAQLAAANAAGEAGWVEDTEIMQGVWGRRWTEKAPSSLQVLVHRVRRELAALGLTGGVIQKRSGWTRLRPDAVRVAEAPES
jgi:hypothetical protein